MGLVANWRERTRRRKAVRRLTTAIDTAARGKDVAELAREGGWDVLALNWEGASDVWESYTTSDLEKVMRISSVVYACVKKICTVAPDAYMEIGRWDGDSWEPDENHPTLELFRQPNPEEDWRMFLWSMVSHLLLTGVSYVWKVKDQTGATVEMHALPSSWVTPKYHGERMTHYEVRFSKYMNAEKVRVDDIFIMAYPDPADPNAGLGPLQAALRDLQIDDARSALMIEIMSNTHFASAVLKQKGLWTDPQMREIRSALKDLIGPGKRGEPIFLGGEGADIEFPQPKSDMDWPGTASLAETRICATFGVSPILIGLRSGLERSTFSNYDQAKAAYYTDTMRPLWDWLASTFERGLFRSEGFDEEVEAYYKHIPELQQDLEKLHDRVRKDFHGGLLTLDRALEAIGEEVVGDAKGGATRLIPMSLIPFEPTEGTEPPVPARPDHDGEEEEE